MRVGPRLIDSLEIVEIALQRNLCQEKVGTGEAGKASRARAELNLDFPEFLVCAT